MIDKLLFDHNRIVCTVDELASLQPEISKVKTVVERMFGPHCPSALFTLTFHLLHHVKADLERFGSLSFRNAASFEHFSVLIEQSCKKIS